MGRNPASHAKPAKRKPAEQRDPKHRSGKNATEGAFAGKARWTDKAWEDYLWWREQDPKIFARINALIEDTLRNPFRGLGKPEPLRHNWTGYWSRRITSEHRLVYKPGKDEIAIAQCRYHY